MEEEKLPKSEISGVVDYLPSVHGSALFTRGETQALQQQLGTSREANQIDSPSQQGEENSCIIISTFLYW
jgi:polyribonucleotide nucleotidyltransferase